MGDSISRQAVDDAIYDSRSCDVNYSQIMKFIDKIQSVTPVEKVGRWIPVSEKLPDNDCECWVTTRDGIGNIVRSCNYTSDLYDLDEYAFEDRRGESGFYNYDSEYGYYEIDDVIAWMAYFKPEPYKEK